MSQSDPTRPSPESFLERAASDDGAKARKRAKLKIFLGAAPGVGKTYAMLQEAKMKHHAGIDVVLALVETHGRAETAALVEGIEQIARRNISYRGQDLSEMDIDAVLARHPQLVLIDEFAHTNAPGSRHAKRWQDVMEVLDAGIDVTTTLNIQHIESLNDVVARITGVRVQETVPDAALERADEIELIDLPPDELISRLKQGKVYQGPQAGRALENFFTKGNLTALRELALRKAASRVDDDMLDLMRSNAVKGPWPTQERLLVCINEAPAAKALVRTGKLMADRARIPWIAVTVITPRHESLDADIRENTANAMRLADTLGAETVTLHSESDVAGELLTFARKRNVTRILIGRARWRASKMRWLSAFTREPVFEKLLSQSTDFEVTVVTPHVKAERRKALKAEEPKSFWQNWRSALMESTLATTVATAIAWPLWFFLPLSSLSAIYLIGVLWVGMRNGMVGAMIGSALSFLSYNFFYTPPLYSFAVEQSESLIALVVFVISATFIGSLAGRLRAQVQAMRVSNHRTETLYDFARKIATAQNTPEVLAAAAMHIASALNCRSLILMPDAAGRLTQVESYPAKTVALDARDETAARWAYEKNTAAGAGTQTLPATPWLFVPLATAKQPMGVIGIQFHDAARKLDPETNRLLLAVEDQVAVAVERMGLASELENSRVREEAEKLRAALLNSVSHDLRTPLVTIIGALSSLTGPVSDPTSETDKRALAAAALGEARRLDRFVQNLLDMTRLGYGSLQPNRTVFDIREIVGRARTDVSRMLFGHTVSVDMPRDLPAVYADPVLINQALTNILQNAAKYTPAGSAVRIQAAVIGDMVQLSVIDDGPGIPESDRERIFDLFYRVSRGDGQPAGTGLGLAIARGFVEANGGKVRAEAAPGGRGAMMVMTLPMAKDQPAEEDEP